MWQYGYVVARGTGFVVHTHYEFVNGEYIPDCWNVRFHYVTRQYGFRGYLKRNHFWFYIGARYYYGFQVGDNDILVYKEIKK